MIAIDIPIDTIRACLLGFMVQCVQYGRIAKTVIQEDLDGYRH